MRALISLSCGAVLLALAGCAAALPGYAPPSKSKLKLPTDSAKSDAGPQTPATVGSDGTYIPSSKERSLSCRRLTGVVQIKIQQVRAETTREPASRITTATESALARPMAGGKLNADGPRQVSQDRAQLVALNALMIEKNCGHFDIDAALAPGNTATPEPIKPPGKQKKQR